MNVHFELAQHIADKFATLPQVDAVTIAGSLTTDTADSGSDIDLYVYAESDIPPAVRDDFFTSSASHMELNNQYWETGDEWQDAATGIKVDVMYRNLAWVREMLERNLEQHQASVGYTTCFWQNVLTSRILFDRNGRFQALKEWAKRPYPTPLVRAIIAKNYPILRDTQSSYLQQIAKAASRGDLVSVNHRVAEFFASYFDIIFAINRLPHPGEKRLLSVINERCEKQPQHMNEHVQALLRAAGQPNDTISNHIHALVDGLDALLTQENLLK
ncbi:MAG: DUF4037 domain-containing protein [Chloroflexi bacterium]|nr:MAG: DUF4037 domain-containing protein [Chloroflexota bacterium]